MNRRKEEMKIKTEDGISLSAYINTSDNPKASLILCHGITVDSTENGFFLDYEDELLKKQINVIRFDFRCHGKSEGAPKELTLKGEYLDLKSIINELVPKLRNPYFMQATSFSGAAVIRNFFENEDLFDGLVLWNPVIDYKKTFLYPSTPWVSSILDTQQKNRLPTWAFAQIPTTKYYITKVMVEEFKKDKTPEILEKIKKPIIAFHGDNDTKIPHIYLEDVSKLNPNIELHILPGFAHGFKKNRDYVVNKTINWLYGEIQ